MLRRNFLPTLATAAAPVVAKAAKAPNAAASPADEFFDITKVQDIRLELDPNDWKTLRENFLENTWYRGRIEWNGVIAEMSLRSRGSGSRNPVKPGLKISFTRKEGTPFLGLNGFALINFYQDATMMKDYLAYDLFHRAGIASPRHTHTRLFINGEYWGVYGISEEVDTRFLQTRFGENNGDLYEYNWSWEYRWEHYSDDPDMYVPDPFEAKNKNADIAAVANWISVMNDTPDDGWTAALSRTMDPQRFLTYLAVESFYDERDGILGNWGINNYYLYRSTKDARFLFIPWDRNTSFEQWERPIFNDAYRNVLTRRLFSRGEFEKYYRAELARVTAIAGGAGGWLDTTLNTRLNEIRSSMDGDPKQPYRRWDVDDKIQQLRDFALRREGFVRSALTR